jgi:hypothetical protein
MGHKQGYPPAVLFTPSKPSPDILAPEGEMGLHVRHAWPYTFPLPCSLPWTLSSFVPLCPSMLFFTKSTASHRKTAQPVSSSLR